MAGTEAEIMVEHYDQLALSHSQLPAQGWLHPQWAEPFPQDQAGWLCMSCL